MKFIMLLKAPKWTERHHSKPCSCQTDKITLFPIYLERSASELMTNVSEKAKLISYYPIEYYIMSVTYM